jgi:hypothetical protein
LKLIAGLRQKGHLGAVRAKYGRLVVPQILCVTTPMAIPLCRHQSQNQARQRTILLAQQKMSYKKHPLKYIALVSFPQANAFFSNTCTSSNV